MKKIFCMMAPVIVGMAGCVGEEAPEVRSLVKVGDTLPEFSVTMADGSTVTTASLRGRESMIVFFTTTCGDCRRELPGINAYADAHPDMQTLCISRSQTQQQVETMWRDLHLTMPYSAQTDAKVYSLFATAGVPRVYLADKDLRVTGVYLLEGDEHLPD